ncbi:unnamed protein product [Peronospora belbahrii]|uniref:Uncharacterized protein n=1 Tax=Peronospora belbahrii TaxID=622444 RepID=A0AAU9KSF5_9STRA|nr:unnamed protein product [Peronospora belbahrii]
MSLQAMSLHSEVPIFENSPPEAVVQFAWREIMRSPINHEDLEHLAALPLSPLPSIIPFSNEVNVEGERATVKTLPTLQCRISRFQMGTTTEEVLAYFAELCNAAENV